MGGISILFVTSLPPEVTNKCAPGYKIHFKINARTVKNDFEYANNFLIVR
nr:MAG TPA: hypothetical protein [Caudoviricetes sp.]